VTYHESAFVETAADIQISLVLPGDCRGRLHRFIFDSSESTAVVTIV